MRPRGRVFDDFVHLFRLSHIILSLSDPRTDLPFLTTDNTDSFVPSLPAVAGLAGLPVTGLVRQSPADFVVEEDLGFDFSGHGSHALVQVRKRGLNTLDVIDAISRISGVAKRDVGFSGLKDRHALTTQWFSVPVEHSRSVNLAGLEHERIEVLSVHRHSKKLRRGSHRGNRFRIRVRAIEGDLDELDIRLAEIKAKGVPNYFGPQRFGHANLQKADALFEGKLRRVSRSERSILLSAARSFIFNQVLSARVMDGTWSALLAGDVAVLDGTNSYFQVEEVTAELQVRLSDFDIHPSGPLYGVGANPAGGKVRACESRAFEENGYRCRGLEKFGLRFQRRPTRLQVKDLQWQVSGDDLELSFYLATGGYATSVLSQAVKPKQEE